MGYGTDKWERRSKDLAEAEGEAALMRPWFVESNSKSEYFQIQTRQDGVMRRLVATCGYKNDADHIVHCVNTYAELVKALNAAQEVIAELLSIAHTEEKG
jgi:precorrin isomerase